MTCPPAASMRAAAAITSITMNGGTSLRSDAANRPRARSLNVASSIDICYLIPCPRLAAFGGLLGHIPYPTRRQSFKDCAMLLPTDLRNKASKLTALTTAIALAVAPISPAFAQQEKGPPTIRDTEAEQLLRDYTRPILRTAGLEKQNIQVAIIN